MTLYLGSDAIEACLQEPAVFVQLKVHFDETMSSVFRDLKKAGVTVSSFWNIHKDMCSMWMPVADVERLLAAVGTWVSYEAELVSVCRTQTGRGMFEWAQAKLVDAKVNTIMEALSDRLTKVQSLTNETAEAECAKSSSEIADVANLSLLGQKRSVNIAYRGRMVKHCVTTVEDETQRRKMSEAKGRGVQSDKLIPLCFETDLVDGFKLPQTEVDAEMLRGCNEARTAANMYITLERQSADGTLAAKVLAIKEKTFSALDRTFRIEICFIEDMAGGAGQTMLLQKVFSALPSAEQPCTPSDTLAKLGSLFASQLFAFPSKQAQQSAALIRTAVTQVRLGRRPMPLDAKCDSDIRRCYEQMSYYLQAKVEAEDGSQSTILGKAALNHLHDVVKRRVAAGQPYTIKRPTLWSLPLAAFSCTER